MGIQSDGLIAHYPFCGNANNATTVPGLHGTVVGATLTSDRFGNANSAYLFDGDLNANGIGLPDQIKLGTSSKLKFNSNQMSISCWIKRIGTSLSGRIVLGGRVNDAYTL